MNHIFDENGLPCSIRRLDSGALTKPHIYFSSCNGGKGCWAYNFPSHMKTSTKIVRQAWDYLQALNKKMRYSNHPVF